MLVFVWRLLSGSSASDDNLISFLGVGRRSVDG